MTEAAFPGGPAPLLVLNIAALTPRLLSHMPALRSVAQPGPGTAPRVAELVPVLPAVTCTMQASMLTGLLPRDHGIVGNGWYFRGLGEILLWRQHNRLVRGEKVWDTARRHFPRYRVANICWWYAMGADTDLTVTPRPVYHADGRKTPDCYTTPPELHGELTSRFGRFPLFDYWGPRAGMASSRWIIGAAGHILHTHRPHLTLVYVPHLDYDLQRFGPHAPQSVRAARELDRALSPLLDTARARGVTIVALSEYGITPVNRPVHLNRLLRRTGLLRVYTQSGMEYLDPWTSPAFAVVDHQIAHVYVRDPRDLPRVRAVLEAAPGVAEVLDREGKTAQSLDHDRAGDLVAVAEPDAWFSYYYWHDDRRAPDFARCVDIHRKPGYDPAELFLDPDDRWVRLRIAVALLRSRLGLRTTLPVVPLDGRHVRGSHGRLPQDPADGPILLHSATDRVPLSTRYSATDVAGLLLELAGVPARLPSRTADRVRR
ncbi:alkaline phosphatase family protein [Streptomyces sp. Inha503]|uniref:alkaline phosphatase family protein n=1 Tax=Streptomyces sp. Inha503 TaxID=3383314 RepID=UPI0039A2EC93